MTQEEFKNLKVGDFVYVPFIEKIATVGTGTAVIGSDKFEKYTYKRLRVEDVVIHDYDPDGDALTSTWYSGLVVKLVKFDTGCLNDDEKKHYVEMYRNYFPCMCRGMAEDTEVYRKENYLEIIYNKEINHDDYQAMALRVMSFRKSDAEKTVNRLNRTNLKLIDQIIKKYKNVKKEVKDFLKD